MKESKLFLNTKDATKAEARALKIGDVIEVVYADMEEPNLELVIRACQSSKLGSWCDVRTINLRDFGQRERTGPPSGLNSPKFRKVANAGAVLLAITLEASIK